MPDEITSNPAPVDTAIPQAPETPIPTPPEPAPPIQAEIPTESKPIAEPQTAQMGGNEPFALEPAETQPTPTPAETPVATNEPTPAQTTSEATPVSQVETPASAPAEIVAPVVAPIITKTFTKSIRELFTKAQLAIQNRKRKKIDRIMTLFAKQTMITNNEVEKLLHVSDATATRYLSTLEKEGKIKQSGKTGHSVFYAKI